MLLTITFQKYSLLQIDRDNTNCKPIAEQTTELTRVRRNEADSSNTVG